MNIGDRAPYFELPDETGTLRTLDGLIADGPIVLFFYPGAMTPGCTKESCHFRDLAAEFAEAGAARVGISGDEVAKQAEFSEKYTFDFPLLSDVSGEVRKAYGVSRNFALAATKRATFVIDSDGTILDIIKSEVRMDKHADEALKTLNKRATT